MPWERTQQERGAHLDVLRVGVKADVVFATSVEDIGLSH